MKRSILLIAIMALVLTSCEKEAQKDVIKMDVSEKTLYSAGKYQIEATSIADINYAVENRYHADVSDEGLVTARFIGETEIALSNGEDIKKLKLVVIPKHNLYNEPDVKFGDTKSSVINKLGKPDSETSTAITYDNYSTAAPVLMITFDDNDKVSAYVVLAKSSLTEILAEYIVERYMPVGQKDGIFAFMNSLDIDTATKLVGMQLYNTSYWMVAYTANSNTKNASLDSIMDQLNIQNLEYLLD